MLKATATGADGRSILLIGLTFGNLERFRQAPLDTFIQIDGREIGLPVDVTIFSCPTEADGAQLLAEHSLIDARTKVTISDKLKS